jgi:predicted ATPase
MDTINMQNIRGSEWRKWDLHIHTPNSLFHNYQATEGDDVWERFIKDLESLPCEFKVLGINDYLFIDGYKKVLEYKQQGRLQNIDLILPVIELRLAKFCGNRQLKRINFHIIFSNEISPDIIQSQFLNGLSTSYKLDTNCNQTQWGGVITKENLEELGKKIIASVPQTEVANYGSNLIEGFNNLNLEVNDILRILENGEQYFKGKYLTCIGKTEWDALNWNDSSIAEKKTIINTVNIVFTAAENIEKYNNGRNKLKESNVNSLLLDCSDAHNNINSTDKDRIGNCNTWIKADTTFEGLKQIIYEPEERVKIQETKPDDKSVYQVIDCVELNEDTFWKGEICFNENLNTIIGGRSTGKSTLLKSIAKKIDYEAEIGDEKENEFVQKHLSNITVKWKDGEESVSRDIDFFRQSYMHDIAKDKTKTNDLIKKIISNKEQNTHLIDYENKNNELKKSISKNILEVFQIQLDIDNLQRQLKEKGDKKGIETEVQRLNTKIQELSKNATITQLELDAFQNSLKDITEKEQLIKQSENDLLHLSSLKNKSIIDTYYINGFDYLSSSIKNEVSEYFDKLKEVVDKKWTEYIGSKEESIKTKKQEYQTQIEQIKNSDTYKRSIQYYSDNKELNDIQNKLKEENGKLQEIKGLEEKLALFKSRKTATISQIVADHNSYNLNAQSLVQNLKIEHDEVKITTKISCKKQAIKTFLENRLNQRGNERQQFVNDFADKYNTDIAKHSNDFLIDALKNNIEYKSSNTNQNVVTEFFTTNWFDISFELSYQNDVFDEMSQGKQAFVILKLLLEFSTKECPILIDQPEDSLDNRAIYNELVQYLRVKKKQRQIILVTHNPNVVVSADAENVIIANQNGKNSENRNNIKFQYINGSLENTKQKNDTNKIVLEAQGIREQVCEILEGGKEAFEKREQKYGFKK